MAGGYESHVRILVVTTEVVSGNQLRQALPGGIDPQEAEVMVVAPALQKSAFRFWMSDADDAIARAEAVRRESLERLGDAGVSASADTGEGGTAAAIEDALKSFPADRILVFTHREGEQRYREDLNEDEVEARFKIPVTRAEIAPPG
ncbi:MAG TPA: hypothetical protein VG371_17985 [Solirubrobacteraceae bacterium]|nr:hypothetical protein [Solirubrobacteraceae bacterium]